MEINQHNYLIEKIAWQKGTSPDYPYIAKKNGEEYLIRLNDFPDENLYTLIVNNVEIADLNDWPEQWIRPDDNQNQQIEKTKELRKERRKRTGRIKTLPKKHKMSVVKVLFLPSNPSDINILRLDQEAHSVDDLLRHSSFRNRFNIESRWVVRISDIKSQLLQHRPDIVHFSGHGSASNMIVLEDDWGKSHSVSGQALGQVFSLVKNNTKCVILDACYSEPQAEAIAEHIDCVIGMSRSIAESVAIHFAAAFYRALAFGNNVKTAFDLGRNEIMLHNIREENTFKLLTKKANPENIVLEDSDQ